MTNYRARCTHCNSNTDTSIESSKGKSRKRGYCRACTKWFSVDAPKVLLFDIETSRVKIEGDVWQMGFHKPQRIRSDWIKDDWFIISWTGKWLFQSESFGDVVKPKEAIERNDKRVTKSLHDAISKADFVVTHNGNRFDIKNINWRFLINNLPPQQRYKSIDTLAKCKEVFGVTSLAMDFLCKQLGYDQKHHTNYGLWERCEAGEKSALQDMYNYNMNDIYMLEDLYLRTRPYFKSHPNFAIFLQSYRELEKDEYQCKVCLEVINESRFTKTWTTPAGYKYKSCQCPHCLTWMRKTTREPYQHVRSN